MVALSFPYVAPSLSFPYVPPSLTLCEPYLAPMLALSGLYGPYLGPYVGPILPLCWPYLGIRLPHHVSKFYPNSIKTPSHVISCVPGHPLNP